MLKHILLASAVVISVPALAQTSPAQETTPSTQPETSPPVDTDESAPADNTMTPAPAPAPTPAPSPTPTPTPTPTPEPRTAQQDAAPADQAAPAQQQAGKQPATAAQIATIVDQGFPTYDKDADGNLKTEEFGAWMVSLRSATEPAFTGQSAADKEWIGKALAMADTDKSGGVNKDELKGFLAPQPAAS